MITDELRKIRSINATKYDNKKAHDKCMSYGYELLGVYSGYQKKYKFRCLKHNKIFSTWFYDISTGRHGLRCCSNELLSARKKKNIIEAKQKCAKLGFLLLSRKWIGSRGSYDFKCIKHNKIYKTTWSILTQEKSLKCCGHERLSDFAKNKIGNKNPNYNPKLTDKERTGNRAVAGWRKKIYKKYDRTCQKCFKQKFGFRELIAHHLESYMSNKELRYDISNGICLCTNCHNEFHRTYGYGNNTRKQFDEFMVKTNGIHT